MPATFILVSPQEGIARLAKMNRLDHGNTYRLLLIVAPENRRKTVRLRAWASQLAAGYGARIAWINLEESHNLPENFLAGLDQALQAEPPQSNNHPEPLPCYLDGGATGSLEGKALEDAVAERINCLAEAAGKLILVLDNYEVIFLPEIHQAVGLLLDYLPPQVLVIISSRSEPPLPLARLRVRRQLLEIDEADLEHLYI